MKKEYKRSIISTAKYITIAMAIVGCTSLSGVAADVENNDNNYSDSSIEVEQTSKGSTREEREIIINKFNEEHGTNYQVVTKEQAELIGQDLQEQEKVFDSMSSEEFEEYLTEVYENEQGIANSEQKLKLENPLFNETDDPDAVTSQEVKRVNDSNEDIDLLKEGIELLND